MTQTARIITRVVGWGIVAIGFLVTFFPQYGTIGSVWTYDGYLAGPWSASAVELNAGVLTTAAIVAVLGIVAVILSYKIPEKA